MVPTITVDFLKIEIVLFIHLHNNIIYRYGNPNVTKLICKLIWMYNRINTTQGSKSTNFAYGRMQKV